MITLSWIQVALGCGALALYMVGWVAFIAGKVVGRHNEERRAEHEIATAYATKHPTANIDFSFNDDGSMYLIERATGADRRILTTYHLNPEKMELAFAKYLHMRGRLDGVQ